MRITGYKLREAIKAWELRRNLAAEQFTNSLTAFEGEGKDAAKNPTRVGAAFERADRAVARLQTAQARYNLAITATVGNETITLTEAVKRVGGAGRLEKLWREAASEKKNDRGYFYREHGTNVRKQDEVYAARTITTENAAKEAAQAARESNELRAAISISNSKEVEIEGLDNSLFE